MSQTHSLLLEEIGKLPLFQGVPQGDLERLIQVAHRKQRQAGKQVEEGVLIDLTLTRQDLAEMSGTTLYTVSRLLSGWEKQGLVLASRERVVICNPHGLAQILEAAAE